MVGVIADMAGAISSGAAHLETSLHLKESNSNVTNGGAVSKKTPLPKFYTDEVYLNEPNNSNYDAHAPQYASEYSQDDPTMRPAVIIYPKGPHADDDVILAIKYASENGLAIAVRTGGHQYSGASSTGGPNIQLDMSKAYKDFEPTETKDGNKRLVTVRMGISFRLSEFNTMLGEKGLFVPHGQCSNVHIGGHAQTGGYGQLSRSFGLFGDTIQKIRIITADGEIREVSRDATDQDEKDLFYGVLGGSPGNFGVLTHLTIKPFKDEDYPDSRGLKLGMLYNPNTLQKLLELKAEMVADDEWPADIDYCVSLASAGQNIVKHLNDKEIHPSVRKAYPELCSDDKSPVWPASIIVYVQWANLDPNERYEGGKAQKFLQRVRDVATHSWGLNFLHLPLEVLLDHNKHTPMSQLTREWIFQHQREFNLPYNKRDYFTNSTDLDKTGWAKKTVDRIDELQKQWPLSGCGVVVQIQHIGGKNSRHRQNDKGPDGKLGERTAYSWRDTSVVCVLDCFYDPKAPFVGHKAKANADAWQTENDTQLKGTGPGEKPGFFSPGFDRRMLWASYEAKEEEFDMGKAWKYYHETPEKFARLCAIKKKFDPQNVFTPNKFCVPTSMPKA